MFGGRLYGGVSINSPYDQTLPASVDSHILIAEETVPSPRLDLPAIFAVRLQSERPPLRLSMNIQTPDGSYTRWSSAETNPLKVHQGLNFTTTLPGGFEHCDVTLIRDPRRAYFDLKELERITIRGVGGSVAWQGRLETIPSVSGNQLSLSPGAVGYQAALQDDNSARELYVEVNLSIWQGPSLNRQTYALNPATGIFDLEGGELASNPDDPLNPGIPALVCHFQGSWIRKHASEMWYDAQGLDIGFMLFSAQVGAASEAGPVGSVANVIGDGPIVGGASTWYFQAGMSQNDALAVPDGLGGWVAYPTFLDDFTSGGPYFTGRVPASGIAFGYPYAWISLTNVPSGTGYGTQGVDYGLYYRWVGLYGTQNLPLYLTDVGAQGHIDTYGVLGSDVLKHAIPKYAPEIAITAQGQSTIVPSSYVIPELAFLTSGTVADIIKGVTSFELQDWAVWEGDDGPCFFWYPRTNPGTVSIRGRLWRTRMGPAQFQSTGPQIDRLYNGVVVNFTDFSGLSRTVGPPLSNCWRTDPSLVDLDPQNPINQWGQGIRKWAPITMSAQATLDQAVATGAVFLQEQKVRNQSGSAQITGYCEDASGIVWPAYMIRAGDQIAFIDAADPSYRRIVSTAYNDDTKTNSITLDTPPDTLQAILTRMQAELSPITGG